MQRKALRICSLLFLVFPCLFQTSANSAEGKNDARKIEFNKDIAPLFARSCTKCHGGVKQASDLSFVDVTAAFGEERGLITPGDPEESEILRRIQSEDPDEQMPPPGEGIAAFSPDEVKLVEQWITEGAQLQDHWSRLPLRNTTPNPSAESSSWAKRPLDHFVWSSLRAQSMAPNGDAPPEQWLRRVTFDLTGLPPTAEEVVKFKTKCAGASQHELDLIYEQEVDQMLERSSYGERWAAMWLDLARYADSKGFEKDPHRDMWPYREWLVNAFNDDMPYTEFTIKQLAGDLLENASYEDRLATAFHRNTQTNTEGGTDDEEFRLAAVIDRLTTTWTVWQASTIGCVQCHDHPYEPIRNEEFYSSLDIFNQTADVDLNDDFPTLPFTRDEAKRKQWNDLVQRYPKLVSELDEKGREQVEESEWKPLSVTQVESSSGTLGVVDGEFKILRGTVAVGSSYTIRTPVAQLTALRIEILPDSDVATDWPEQGAVLSQIELQISGAKPDDKPRQVELAAIVPDFRIGPHKYEDIFKNNSAGFGGYPKLLQPRWCVVILKEPISLASDEELEIKLRNKASVTGGLSNHLRRFKISATSDEKLTTFIGSEDYQTLKRQLDKVSAELTGIKGTSVPIMQTHSGEKSRVTRVFHRGNWLERGEQVAPGIPKVFTDASARQVKDSTGFEIPSSLDRLEFARWLVSDSNPVAPRVWVNRVWAELFGVGIVESQEDFGASGTRPTHPKLLDHLAFKTTRDFQWRLKALLKEIVLSSTYRQDARTDKDTYRKDPKNRWFARGPRTRLTAEMVRDQALVASGMATEKIGGPSVMPPQPDGVWQQAYSNSKWKTATDANRYRRALYTYWRRTSPYPGMMMFDTPTRDVCSPRRQPTNTPLQALVTLNSQVYVELAEALGQKCISEAQGDVKQAISNMLLRVNSVMPAGEDVDALFELYETISASRAKSKQMEERPPSPANSAKDNSGVELDPLGIVALAVLNSDRALTK